jgi:hypothetical protein
MSIKFRRIFAFILFVSLVLSSIPAQSAYAGSIVGSSIHNQVVEEPCSSSQVILIIDQSVSMGRNDPNDLRFFIPMHVADILARNYINARLTASRLERPMKVQLAVVQFASQALIGLDWTTIAPVDDAAWQEQRQDILDYGLLTTEDYGTMYQTINTGTNMRAAFDKVGTLIENADPQINGCPSRTYLMLTDGNPDSGGDPIKEPQLKEYMQGVQNLVDGQLLGDGNTLFVTAINDSNDNYWRDTETYWQQITHEDERTNDNEPERALKVSTKAEIGYRMGGIVNYQLNQGRVIAQVGPNIIPPYLERVIFTFYKPDRDNIIELAGPNGTILQEGPDVIISGQGEGIQTIELIRPEPGTYQLTTTARTGEYYITKDLIFIKTSFISDASGLFQLGCFPIQISLVDSSNQPIPKYNDPKYRLNIESTVTSVESGKVMPISLTHEMDSGKIVGSFTPLYPGENKLSITATALDDEQKIWVVLEPPFADFDLQVDRLNLQIGEAANSLNGECPVAQYSLMRLPLVFSAASTGEPVQMCVKPTMSAESDGFEKITFVGPDTQGRYEFQGVPTKSGDVEVSVSATGSDLLNSETISVAKAAEVIFVQDGHRYQFSANDISVKPGKLLLWLNQFKLKLLGQAEPDAWVIGRRFFFGKPNISILATLKEAGASVDRPELLPVASLIPIKGEQVDGAAWQSSAGQWSSAFEAVPVGCYALEFTYDKPPCGADMQVQQNVQSICVVPDMSEWIARVILTLLALAILIFLVRWLLCRFWNPLSGYLAIIDQNNHTVWYCPLDGNSCWDFELDEVHTCMLARIKMVGVFRKRGNAILKLYTRNQNTMKVECNKKIEVEIGKNWRPVLFGVGCRIHWVQDQNQLPH